jgi:hypothetical protein
MTMVPTTASPLTRVSTDTRFLVAEGSGTLARYVLVAALNRARRLGGVWPRSFALLSCSCLA